MASSIYCRPSNHNFWDGLLFNFFIWKPWTGGPVWTTFSRNVHVQTLAYSPSQPTPPRQDGEPTSTRIRCSGFEAHRWRWATLTSWSFGQTIAGSPFHRSPIQWLHTLSWWVKSTSKEGPGAWELVPVLGAAVPAGSRAAPVGCGISAMTWSFSWLTFQEASDVLSWKVSRTLGLSKVWGLSVEWHHPPVVCRIILHTLDRG